MRGTFCGRHVLPGANVFGHFLFIYFLFNGPFYADTYRTFCDAAFDLPSTFFCLCNTRLFVTFRTSSGVAGPNIILLYIGMVSKSIRYSGISEIGPRALKAPETFRTRRENSETIRNVDISESFLEQFFDSGSMRRSLHRSRSEDIWVKWLTQFFLYIPGFRNVSKWFENTFWHRVNELSKSGRCIYGATGRNSCHAVLDNVTEL